MDSISTFLNSFDGEYLLYLLLQALVALFCIVIHEMSHGYAAFLLGDTTAKEQGRLSLNPLHHIDPWGLLLMITAGFGWAKPVSVDMRRFRHPKRDMALTALAGPVSNFVLAWLALVLAGVLYRVDTYPGMTALAASWAFYFLIRLAMLSAGLGVFNLIPIPPLDGSKVLFSLLPDRIYYTILRYERYVMLLLFALVFLGWLDGPLVVLRTAALNLLGRLVGFPSGFFG